MITWEQGGMDQVRSTAAPGSSGLTPYRLDKPNLKDAVATSIRALIFSGQLRPGERIDQKEIANALGVSKLPVREALITLESEGLIKNVPRHGAFVEALNPSDVRDHFVVYGMVAGLAAELAAKEIGDAELVELEQILDTMDSTDDLDELERLNFRFHRRINQLGSSRRLRVSLRNLVNGLPPRFYANNPGWATIARDDHRAILSALGAGDGSQARKAVEEHLSHSADYAIDALRRRSFWGLPA